MKPLLENIETGDDSSIKVKSYTQSLIDVPLHYHPEHEIVFIRKGKGKLFLADTEEEFQTSQLFFIKGNIPHLFEDDGMITGKKNISKVTVVQYRQNLFEKLYNIPEFFALKELETALGYGFKMKMTKKVQDMMDGMEKKSGLPKFNTLLSVLNEIVQDKNKSVLGHFATRSDPIQISYLRIQKMHNFLSGYFSRDISIDEVANVLHLCKTGFCRFVKRETGKTFSEHLNQYRIQHACTLLRQSPDNVMEICYACGYNNPAYFFRQFKKLKRQSPMEYRKSFEPVNS